MERMLGYGSLRADDIQTLHDVGLAMTQTSLCGLGQTASLAIRSAVDRWPELIDPGRGNGRVG